MWLAGSWLSWMMAVDGGGCSVMRHLAGVVFVDQLQVECLVELAAKREGPVSKPAGRSGDGSRREPDIGRTGGVARAGLCGP